MGSPTKDVDSALRDLKKLAARAKRYIERAPKISDQATEARTSGDKVYADAMTKLEKRVFLQHKDLTERLDVAKNELLKAETAKAVFEDAAPGSQERKDAEKSMKKTVAGYATQRKKCINAMGGLDTSFTLAKDFAKRHKVKAAATAAKAGAKAGAAGG